MISFPPSPFDLLIVLLTTTCWAHQDYRKFAAHSGHHVASQARASLTFVRCKTYSAYCVALAAHSVESLRLADP